MSVDFGMFVPFVFFLCGPTIPFQNPITFSASVCIKTFIKNIFGYRFWSAKQKFQCIFMAGQN